MKNLAIVNPMDEEIRQVVQKAIREHQFPGAIIGYATPTTKHVIPVGHLTYEATAPPVTEQTIYDLASVTKAIPTSTLILKLIELGRLSTEDRVIQFIPELRNTYRDRILIRHLLTFTVAFDLKVGLKSFAPKGVNAIMEALYQAQLSFPPGEQYFYSNAPALLLGIAAERVVGRSLDLIADSLLFQPLNMESTTFHPERLNIDRIAPTEINERGIVRGVVHDETAYAFYKEGKISGHAGLFSTAGDLLTFGQMLLNHGRYQGVQILAPVTIERIQTEVRHDGDFGMTLGWEINHQDYMIPTQHPGVFGKDGFTGTMFLINPKSQICLVMLSNRTYPKRPEPGSTTNQVRQAIETIVFN